MNRAEMLRRAGDREKIWDFVIIGGGATGIGCAVDAASRGYNVLLLEQNDFGKGTSSRSTKLVHGGVRYLAQGNLRLVKDALRERGLLRKNAAHLVTIQSFVIPCYSIWEKIFYGAGLKIYNRLSKKYGFGRSKILSAKETIRRLPNVKIENLRGGVLYFDGQFDDSRLLIDLVKTAADIDATVLNYAPVIELTKSKNKIDGVRFRDQETGEEFTVKSKIVINATGAFCDRVRRMSDEKAEKIIAPSQGIHLVFDRSFLPSENAVMIPRTGDRRILFVIPWHGKTLIGTTDTPIETVELEPKAFEKEIEFVLETAGNYLQKQLTREDILSVFVGVRPLVKHAKTKNTAALARDHIIEIDESNLLTITGGKWTTYRQMAEDAINQACAKIDLPMKNCQTEHLKIHGSSGEDSNQFGDLAIYGSDAEKIENLIAESPGLARKLHAGLPYRAAEIVWAIRFEMARTVEDVLARRTRVLFTDARAAIEIAPPVAEIMAGELRKDKVWIDGQIEKFIELAKGYLPF